MTKIRVLVFLLTVIIVIFCGTLASLYARGYRFDSGKFKISPNGLLVIKSDPDSAQVYVNSELKTATNATVPLSPGTYDVEVRKEGFMSWYKRLVIEKEIVTEATAHLFKSAASLSAITFSSSYNPTISKDFTKIAFISPPNASVDSANGEGLWIIEMINLPLGFVREPRKITDGDLTDAKLMWSPDGREILISTSTGKFLINSGTFTTQANRVNITATYDKIVSDWQEKNETRKNAQLRKLPDEMQDILKRKASSFVFSPDEDMVLYLASSSATIVPNLIKQIPGSSTQKQERDIKANQTYVYDIKEDRNFLIDSNSADVIIEGGNSITNKQMVSWFPTSRDLVVAEAEKISIVDYDGTNRQTVYQGSYVNPYAFPTLSTDRLIILTNLGASSTPPNLYSLSLK